MTLSARLAAAIILVVLLASPALARQTKPVFENGMAQEIPALANTDEWIRQALWVETEFDSDGDGKLDRVHVAVTRPKQTETEGMKVPVIYGSSPYYSGTAPGDYMFWNVRHEVGEEPPTRIGAEPVVARTQPFISNGFNAYWVPRGFAVVHSESPGTGQSQGCPTVGGINESLAPKAVIDWLNGRAKGFTTIDGNEQVRATWTTGKVGMTGTSYNGTLPLAAATTGVAGLEAIIPDAPNTSYWHYYRANGLVRHPGGYLGEDIQVLYDFIHSGNPTRDAWCDANVRDVEMAQGQDRTTGDYTEFWRGRDYTHVTPKVKAAVFLAHGLSDWNVMPDHSIRIYQALKAQGKKPMLYLHQGGHGGPPPPDMQNRYFSHYLYGVDNGIDQGPRSYIVREGADRNAPTAYAEYPHPDAAPVTMVPQAGGHGAGDLSFNRGTWQGTEKLVDNVSFDARALATAEFTEHRLMYVSPVLSDSVHLSGAARVTIKAAVNGDAANLSVYLVSLPWAERRERRGQQIVTVEQGGVITRGWADLQNHASLTESEPLIPGEFYTMSFDLEPDDQVIPAGQQIGLMIFSSDRDFTLWPRPGTEITVDLDGTSITLPIVGGPKALGQALGGN